jgi:amidase
LQVLAGAHPRDPWSITAPIEGGPLKRPLKVALHLGDAGQCDPAVRAQVQRAADTLAQAGYDVQEAAPPAYEKAALLWANLLASEFATARDRLLPIMGEDGRTFAEGFLRQYGSAKTVEGFSTLLAQREGVAREWSEFMAKFPLLLTPCWNRLPFAHGADIGTPDSIADTLQAVRPVVHANLLGLPSVCVPAGLDPYSGLPVGVLLTGPRLREDLCLEAAAHVERGSNCGTPIDPR